MWKYSRPSKEKIQTILIFITFIFIMWAPATGGSTLSSGTLKLVARISYFVLAGIIALLTEWRKVLPMTSISIALTPLFYYAIHFVWVYNSIGASVSSTLLCILFALQSENIKTNVYKLIKWFLVITAAVGIVCYVSYVFDLGLPYETVPYYSGRSSQSYINYRVCYIYFDHTMSTRLCGLFNEPGWFGTFLAFYLCAENLKLNKISNMIILLAGILTFSLAFVLIILFYYMIANIMNWKRWFWVALLCFFYLAVLPQIKTGNAQADTLIDRMVITKEGLKGANRNTDDFNRAFQKAMRGKAALFGMGSGYYITVGGAGGNCSIKSDIMDFGIVGTMAMYVPVFIFLIYKSRWNRKAIFFLICIAISLYQRPWLFEVSNFILSLGAVSYLNEKALYEKNKYVDRYGIQNREACSLYKKEKNI